MTIRQIELLLAIVLLVLAAAVPAQNFPNRPLRLVVPFSAGGAADVPARILTQKLSEALGQQVIVDNKPGAGSTIGAEAVAKAPPDGYNLLMISNTHFVSAALYKKLSYDSVADFAAVTQVTTAPNVIVVHPSLPVKNVKELIALAKAKPGKIDYASSGNGSTQHLTGALFTKMAGIDMMHIPYRGSGPATADLLSGQVTVGFPGIAGMLPQIRAGKLRALAVSSLKRNANLPDVPTVDETMIKGFNADAWFGLFAPAGTPPEIIARLNAELQKALADPATAETIVKAGFDITPSSAADLTAFVKTEIVKWAKVVKDSGAKAE